jgi:CP family cyanate transporter-like MFS transporter
LTTRTSGLARARRLIGPAAGGTAAVLVAAVCMRTPLTAVGPVLGLIGGDTGLNNTVLGLLSALPLLAFSAVSPVVHEPVRRIGIERTVVWALAALAVGVAVRSLPGLAALWAGTVIAGAGIAVCNVLIPVVIRRDHPARVPLMTGLYSATMGAAAALASGVSLPLAQLPGGWRWSLGVWAAPAAAAAVVWSRRRPQARGAALDRTPAADGADPADRAIPVGGADPADGPIPVGGADPADRAIPVGGADPAGGGRSVWRSATAWRLTAVMGLQSTTFYILAAWLPSIATSHGSSDTLGGWYLFAYQVVGLLAGLAVPAVLKHAGTAATGVLIGAPMVVSCLGLIAVPAALPAWVFLAGVSSGSALVYALTRISLAARSSAHATRLSGMAQSVGYLLAATGPVAAGWLRDRTGSWTATLVLVASLAAIQATTAAVRSSDQRT